MSIRGKGEEAVGRVLQGAQYGEYLCGGEIWLVG